MDDRTRLDLLEHTLAQMLKPIKNIPLNIAITSLSGKRVIKFDHSDSKDQQLLDLLKKAILFCAAEMKRKPIERARANEVGNDVEHYVVRALRTVGMTPASPVSINGKSKSAGYPDLLFYDTFKRPTYLECKTFAEGKPPSTFRSFYLSPSDDFKVSLDARHLLLAFGMSEKPNVRAGRSAFKPVSYRLVDLHDLLCDVKYEFNSDNKRIYSEDLLLSSGSV